LFPSPMADAYRAAGWWSDRTFADYVASHARTIPDRTAYVIGDHRLSWAALDRDASGHATRLIDAGCEVGDRVAVWLPDGPVVHAVLLGAEKAGLTVVGIGARAGERETRHLLAKTGATVLVTHALQRGQVMAQVFADMRAGTALRQHVVVPRHDETASIAGASPHPALERRLGPDDLFLINSTSGTTGMPKCVRHTQNRWAYFHRKAVENAGLSDADVILAAVPMPFGFGLWTSHSTPILLGATTVLVERFDADEVLDLVARHQVTMLACVSTQFIMLLNSPHLPDVDLSSLRVMFTGGEAVPFERAREFEAVTGATVLQFYGSNETGLLSGTRLSDPPDVRLRTAGTIVPEMEVRLFDGDRDVTTEGYGQPGCRGPALSAGYLDDDDANRQLYTADGWMLMGDLCTIDSRGVLSVVGRTSDIIIRGGKNISAAQVEDEVATHPAVALAAAVPLPDPVFGERVCVYAALRPGATLALDELVAHLLGRGVGKELLPEELVVVDELPRSSGGKIAKAELRAWAAGRRST
jgi:acyl-CoA synthetase